MYTPSSIENTYDKMKETVADKTSQMADTVKHKADSLKKEASVDGTLSSLSCFGDSVCKHIKHSPFQSALVALGIGYVIGSFASR